MPRHLLEFHTIETMEFADGVSWVVLVPGTADHAGEKTHATHALAYAAARVYTDQHHHDIRWIHDRQTSPPSAS